MKIKTLKTLEDDEPKKIEIHFYSSISIGYFGVRYKPEYGASDMILKFDKFFNVDVALNGL